MDSKRPLPLFVNPFALWTRLAFQIWGLGESARPANAPANPVAVAVIPANDAPPPSARRKHKPAKRAAARKKRKAKSKRASRRA